MRTAYRPLLPLLLLALPFAACSNDFDEYEFSDDGGTGGINVGGTAPTGGGGSGGAGATGGTPAGGTGGLNVGGTTGGGTTGGGGVPTGGGGVPAGGGGTTSCAGNQKLCGTQCVAINDPAYGCTAAGCDPCTLPNATTQCASGQCALLTCTPAFYNCDKNAGNGCEQTVDTTSHCGACDRACSTTNSQPTGCAQSKCVHSCDSGFGDCNQPSTGADDGCETNLATSNTNCGACGNACGLQGAIGSGGFGCKTGKCGCSDNAQCGSQAGVLCQVATGLCLCDTTTPCNAGEACAKSGPNTVCRCNGAEACTAGQTCCPGSTKNCKDLTNDAANCGACGNACGAGKTCVNSQCV